MSTLQVSNIHFESTGNNRLQFAGSNSYNLVGGGVTVATINSTAVGFPVNFSVNNVVANDSFLVGSVLVANSTVVNATHLGGVISSSYQLNSTLSANVATLTANNTSFVGTVSAANVVSNAQLSSNLSNYQTTAGLSANVAKLTANNTTYVNGKTEGQLSVNNSVYLNGSAASVYDKFPSGTTMLFVQTAAPTGWTKSLTHNDKVLRIVSGTAGSGGTVAFSSAMTSRSVSGTTGSTTQGGSISTTTAGGSISGTVGSTTLTEAQIPSHIHTITTVSGGTGTKNGPQISQPNLTTYSSISTDATGGGGSHNHSFSGSFTGTSHSHTFTGSGHTHSFSSSLDMSVQYVDAIIAAKD